MTGPDRIDAARVSLLLPAATARTEIVAGDGTLQWLGELLERYAPAHRYVIIADATVAGLYAPAMLDDLERSGVRAELVTFAGGEASKTAGTWAKLLEEMAARGVGRDSCVIGLGGGVTTDLAGFVASTFMRGVPAVQVPTSLLAMIDAAIGGKTGIDLAAGKNLAGTFHQPRLVLVDFAALRTLPDPELTAGVAEAIKHGAIADATYLDRLGRDAEAILARDPVALTALVGGSIRIKAGFVVQDAMETGVRAALNFGHTVGHAIERVSGYRVPHGHAVATGMLAEAAIGESVRVTDPGTVDRLRELIAINGLPVRPPPGVGPEAVVEAASTDKKARRDTVLYTLLRRTGEVASTADGAWTHAIPGDAVVRALASLWGAPQAAPRRAD